METYNAALQTKVQEVLAWAYQQGYAYAEEAAQEFAQANGLTIKRRDLGAYGETITFEPK
jgi:hypothetical protein